MKKIEIRKLNSLRAIAALMVLVSHYSNSTNFLNGVLGHGSGQIGVMIFFVLSGFLMSFLYLNKGFEVKTYIVSRLARVLPLFVFVVLLSFFSQQIFINGVFYKVLDVNSLISHLFLLSGVSVLWTIPTEIQFYILFIPLCWLFIYNKIYMYTLLFIVFFILYFLNFPNPQYDIDNILISGYIFRSLPYFFIGIIFGQLYLKLNTSFLKLQSNFYVLVIPIILIAYPEIYLLLFDYKYIITFDADGEQTQYLKSVLNFSSEYQGQFNRTQLFCKKLKELDLLEPMQAQITLPSGEKMNLGGFQAVNREKLKALTNEQLGELAKTDELELIYLHLQSMKNFNAMVNKISSADVDSEAKPEEAKAPKEGLH